MSNEQLGISVDDNAEGKIVIEFSRNVCHIEFTPEQAAAFAKTIAERVVKVVPQTPIILPFH